MCQTPFFRTSACAAASACALAKASSSALRRICRRVAVPWLVVGWWLHQGQGPKMPWKSVYFGTEKVELEKPNSKAKNHHLFLFHISTAVIIFIHFLQLFRKISTVLVACEDYGWLQHDAKMLWMWWPTAHIISCNFQDCCVNLSGPTPTKKPHHWHLLHLFLPSTQESLSFSLCLVAFRSKLWMSSPPKPASAS